MDHVLERAGSDVNVKWGVWRHHLSHLAVVPDGGGRITRLEMSVLERKENPKRRQMERHNIKPKG